MEWNVTAFAALGLGLVVGGLTVFLLQRRAGSNDRERAEQLAKELDETREELEGHRDEVSRHFERTSNLFRDLTEQYTRLYAHLAEGSRSFSSDETPPLDLGLEVRQLEPRNAGAEASEEAPAQSGNGDGRAPSPSG